MPPPPLLHLRRGEILEAVYLCKRERGEERVDSLKASKAIESVYSGDR